MINRRRGLLFACTIFALYGQWSFSKKFWNFSETPNDIHFIQDETRKKPQNAEQASAGESERKDDDMNLDAAVSVDTIPDTTDSTTGTQQRSTATGTTIEKPTTPAPVTRKPTTSAPISAPAAYNSTAALTLKTSAPTNNPTSAPTKAPVVNTMPEKCEYSEKDLRLIAERNDTIELSPTPKTEADLVALYGSSRTFRPMTSELDIWNDTIPFLNVSTVAKAPAHPFHSGYRNQMMLVTAFYMKVAAAGYDQVILQSLNHVDQYNTNEREGVRHQDLFDVKHWNTFYPALPRLVHCDPKAFPEFSCTGLVSHYSHVMEEQDCVTKPYRYWPSWPTPWTNFREFQAYQVRKGPLMEITDEWPNPVHKTMLQALRIHPNLMKIAHEHMANTRTNHRQKGNNQTLEDDNNVDPNTTPTYMALHARIEPDMVYHNFGCQEMDGGRLRTLFEVIDVVERHWPEPPVQNVFLPINRIVIEQQIEKYENDTEFKRIRTESAVVNLQQLNHVIEHGMWNGTVPVFEFGPNALQGTPYWRWKSICGAATDYELARNAEILVGAVHSSFSVDLAADRFFRGVHENYLFNETGVYQWTRPKDEYPPHLMCCPSKPGKCVE